jgi:hypothetical protein
MFSPIGGKIPLQNPALTIEQGRGICKSDLINGQEHLPGPQTNFP